MAITPGAANFVPGANRIQIGFDPKSINQVISGCWGLGAWGASVAYRYSREIALETYRQIVANHPRDTRFSVRQIQVSYTLNNQLARGETYDYAMSQWIIIGRTPQGWPRFRKRISNATEGEYRVSWKGDTPIARRYKNDPTRAAPYPDPEAEQLARVRLLSGERRRSILMPAEIPEYKNWSAKKTIHVFSNAKYEKYLNYGSQGRGGLYYWETAFATAASIANQSLVALGFDQSVITDQQNKINHYRDIVSSFVGTQVYQP